MKIKMEIKTNNEHTLVKAYSGVPSAPSVVFTNPFHNNEKNENFNY